MPQEITTPRRESSTGRTTAASLGPSICDADQWLDHTAALHFVIVLANDPLLCWPRCSCRESSSGRRQSPRAQSIGCVDDG